MEEGVGLRRHRLAALPPTRCLTCVCLGPRSQQRAMAFLRVPTKGSGGGTAFVEIVPTATVDVLKAVVAVGEGGFFPLQFLFGVAEDPLPSHADALTLNRRAMLARYPVLHVVCGSVSGPLQGGGVVVFLQRGYGRDDITPATVMILYGSKKRLDAEAVSVGPSSPHPTEPFIT